MIVGKVIGNVWATRKHDGLSGLKLMIVKPYDYETKVEGYPIVAADIIGAGIGDMVLVVTGSTAKFAVGKADITPVDSTIVGIIDEVDLKN